MEAKGSTFLKVTGILMIVFGAAPHKILCK